MVLELLLYLDALELTQDSEEKPYFYKSQVEKVRAIRRFMEEHMEETYTQEELSKRFWHLPDNDEEVLFHYVWHNNGSMADLVPDESGGCASEERTKLKCGGDCRAGRI